MKLRYADIQGFMSMDNIPRKPHRLPLGDVTVLLGANGSGKSNVLAFFKMLHSLSLGNLSNFVGKYGADRLLHYGPKYTRHIDYMMFFDDDAEITYQARLAHSLSDGVYFVDERPELAWERVAYGQKAPDTYGSVKFRKYIDSDGIQCISGHYFVTANEKKLGESGLPLHGNEVSKRICDFLSGIHLYQFHDTGESSRIRGRCYIDDAQYLHPDGGNLAAFLKMLREHQDWNRYYERIVRHIRSVMPQFGDFELTPLPSAADYVRLNWHDNSGNDYLFDPHQLSDGTLRFMALATLLLQPPQLLPSLIVLDEPELGLHPDAIGKLGGIIRMASHHAQVLLATQSTRLVDEFDPEEIVIVEQDNERKSTVLRQIDPEGLRDWLDQYSLSQLWEKNVLGGQP
ncbi:MAG: AAA family ATPase [Lachnospiraceae bacterium]|nr:AAA family ATPase [Lachnospiraceae bacterium]